MRNLWKWLKKIFFPPSEVEYLERAFGAVFRSGLEATTNYAEWRECALAFLMMLRIYRSFGNEFGVVPASEQIIKDCEAAIEKVSLLLEEERKDWEYDETFEGNEAVGVGAAANH